MPALQPLDELNAFQMSSAILGSAAACVGRRKQPLLYVVAYSARGDVGCVAKLQEVVAVGKHEKNMTV